MGVGGLVQTVMVSWLTHPASTSTVSSLIGGMRGVIPNTSSLPVDTIIFAENAENVV
jgi:hypothetical protein